MLLLNQMGSKLAMRSGIGFKTCYALRNWVQNLLCAQEMSRVWTIYVKKMVGSGSEFGGVRVWRAEP